MKIDTSTTAGKIQVMQAHADGKIIQVRVDRAGGWVEKEPRWNWTSIDYRIKPQTLHQAAQDSINYDEEHTEYVDGYHAGAEFGAQWQKEKDL